MRRSAFTLLELLLVLAIIIIISGLGVAAYQRQYARSQFKNGVVQIQVDLSLARILAMRTGNAYVFRYVPGSGIYEIAPLKTLQETLYRMNDGLYDEESPDALGGSLGAFGAMNATTSFASSLGYDALGVAGASTVYTDDLFSPENIAADMAAAARQNERESRVGTSAVDLAGGLGGATTNLNSSLATAPRSAVFGGSLGSDTSMPNLGVGDGTSPYGYVDDYSGTGAQFALGADLSLGLERPQTTLRDLEGTEKLLQDENTLATRVNLDGLIIRKQTNNSVVFTYSRLSKSTPTILKSHRETGVKDTGVDPITGTSEGEDLGSALGGSLLSIPEASDGEGLGGSLNSTPGYEDDILTAFDQTEQENAFVSLWSEPLVFYPNGKTSSAVLGFVSLGNYTFYSEIALRGMTGVARISGISGAPVEYYAGLSALTSEQLFRLQNPDVQTLDTIGQATSGGALGVDASNGGALGEYGLGADLDVNATPALDFDAGFDASAESAQPFLNYGSSDRVGYGSRERRSGYSFNENNAVGTESATNGFGAQPSMAEDVGIQTNGFGGQTDDMSAQFNALGTQLGGATNQTNDLGTQLNNAQPQTNNARTQNGTRNANALGATNVQASDDEDQETPGVGGSL